jgi:hypothetical protein
MYKVCQNPQFQLSIFNTLLMKSLPLYLLTSVFYFIIFLECFHITVLLAVHKYFKKGATAVIVVEVVAVFVVAIITTGLQCSNHNVIEFFQCN